LANEIDRIGYAVVNQFLDQHDIVKLRDFAESIVDNTKGEFIDVRDPNQLIGTVLADIPRSMEFKNIFQGLAAFHTGKVHTSFDLYNVVRFLKGLSGRGVSSYFHYDSYIVTAVLPIEIPKDEGNLLLLKDTRPIRRWYGINLFDKMLVERKKRQNKLLKLAQQQSNKVISVKLVPGNLYFFWGYQTIHTNEPCDPNKLRATAVYHYGDPHKRSSLRALIRRYRGVEYA
jgi:hypothetical protein